MVLGLIVCCEPESRIRIATPVGYTSHSWRRESAMVAVEDCRNLPHIEEGRDERLVKEEGPGSIMRPSISLENNRSQVREVLRRFGMTNPRVFGSAARGEDTDKSDLDILVDAPPGTSLYDLAAIEVELETILKCKVEVLTKGFLASDIAERAEIDHVPIA
jgi:uncharacterized protein